MKRIATCAVMVILVLLNGRLSTAGEVKLSVAASLRETIDELARNFAIKNPGVHFSRNYGASGTLAKQIEHGAPADIFISANTEWMDYLKSRKIVYPPSIRTFAFNTLVVAGRSPIAVHGMQDLVKLKQIAIGSPKSVPAGEYAVEAIKRAGIEKQVEKRLVMGKDVRACLMYAERGEVDAAFVYRSDAMQAKDVAILITVPQELYPRVVYPMSLTLTGARNKEAEAFFRYLQGSEARAVLSKNGFTFK